ncbi:MAG: HAD-IA family hydrolase [Hyphomicrobiaceae bacterium]
MALANAGWPRVVVFDLDGTLVDSAADIAASLSAGFAPLGVGPFDARTAQGFIGGGAMVAIERAARATGTVVDDAAKTAIYNRFMETYAVVSAHGEGLFPGAHEILTLLKSEKRYLALCTNKAQPIAEIALKALGIMHYFDTVIGAAEPQQRKPHPEPLLRAIAPSGLGVAEAIMIGDSPADIGAAKAAGCRSIAVSYGYTPIPPRELGADAVVDRLMEIPEVLARLAR